MKLLLSVAVLAALGLMAPTAAEESVSQAFSVGANLVPEVAIESISGHQLKIDLINALANFLTLLDEEIERMYVWATREVVVEATAREHEIENMVNSLPGNAGPNVFDFELSHLSDIYREVVELVLTTRRAASYAHESRRHSAISLREVLLQRLGLEPQVGQRSIYSLKELFSTLHESVISPDLTILHSWVQRVMNEGESSVRAAALTIQHQKREKHLTSLLGSIKGIAINLQRFDAILAAHTSPTFWSEYVYQRDRLYHL